MPSRYAAFTTRTGEVPGRAVARHTLPHKTKWVHELLATHGDGHMHLAPIYSSWINQGESWFANIEHDVIARRGVHLRARLEEETPTIPPQVQRAAQTGEVEVP